MARPGMITLSFRNLLKGGVALLGIGAASAIATDYGLWIEDISPQDEEALERLKLQLHEPMPSRKQRVDHMLSGTKEDPFDVLIIGGGATGTGCAVDSQTRGLRTALLERDDFASATSSKSTKLVHGGVRYLEKAVWNFDTGQLKLVFEALHERKRLLQNASHLSDSLPIMTIPVEATKSCACSQTLDAVAGTQGLQMSRYTSPKESLRQFPTLAPFGPTGRSLKGSIVYYDGQFNDTRLCLALACTAALAGAAVLNHAAVTSFIKDKDEKVIGAKWQDNLSGRHHSVYAKKVINATGPFADQVRQLSDDRAPRMIMPSAGVHITLPDYYSPEKLGMIVPKTADGRVVFMLPWLEATIAGTTDSSVEITQQPQPTEAEIQFILDAIAKYVVVEVRRSDVQSAWSGIRPLAQDPHAIDTASASRDHIVATSPADGMITVAGGKWTTYRKMAQDAIDTAVDSGGFTAITSPCRTMHLPLVGSAGYTRSLFTDVAQHYVVPHRPGAIDTQVAKYLAEAYGDRAKNVTRIAEQRKLGRRLVRGHPVIEAEVIYALHNEMCETPEDFIARRTRLAFVDVAATHQALPRIVELMAEEKGWWRWRKGAELRRAQRYLDTFHAKLEDKQDVQAAESASGVSGGKA